MRFLLGGILDLISHFHGPGFNLAGYICSHLTNFMCTFLDAFPGFQGRALNGAAGFFCGVFDGITRFFGGGFGFLNDWLGLGLFFAAGEVNGEHYGKEEQEVVFERGIFHWIHDIGFRLNFRQ